MDAGAFVQENKRWLAGVGIGLLAWWIASGVIGALYTTRGVAKSARDFGALTAAYDNAALAAARNESEQLQQERERLTQALAFVVADRYARWDGPADTHLFLTGRDLRQAIQDAASVRDVVVDDASITWDVATGEEQIRRRLFGLDVLDQIQQRLFAAHDRCLREDEDAAGLSQILSLKLEPDRSRNRGRPRGRRRGRAVDLGDLLVEQKVSLQFQADEMTITWFLEGCRQPGRTLVVDRWQVLKPARPGEPCTVKATLAGISFLQAESSDA
ncbi:MAG TPA: hypothetical protein ENI87_11300 [bacterium]|nr:hypothetical protein [bacterium]